ncbi:hypothetical protein AWRIB419_1432 [Oenococcus oeni AWRIB419]|uniref:Uncharacterized protein n=1 Tax=Oenococcus oeni AWRIB429 TaxID=655225 RepID=D3LBY1_OENOE|nr:hypothetical protein AWRIB429_1861 [Oenococcus oeni AWRIB429]EJN91488.1 hypothetical protein AWRIB304_1676 [Oenococcus oeni AWRIB304]EJN99695.1 hypothetical protein AWRIB419_1432 [Oenococcus oeni AWRIB419]EJO01436.1 hypothetical protein AWRIB418_1170 [Oenococcus oeni AWRIB418]EJO03071.1 hypothetical protein AWRIB318_258 [Oenococcus oeni AWRIB318]EJO04634.1 hypothetical protein AWRIB422_1590 [Oenococcus oeni AWRIB422]EJO06626.1 hypothetical protein AWRIB548_658 [Oenococcus oeni AWRIB548]EJ
MNYLIKTTDFNPWFFFAQKFKKISHLKQWFQGLWNLDKTKKPLNNLIWGI